MVAVAVTSAEVMARVREAYLASDLTYLQIGLRMGYAHPDTARQMAFQFVNHTRRPQAATLARFARAVRVPVARLLAAPSR